MSVVINVPVDLREYLNPNSRIVYLAVNKSLNGVSKGVEAVLWTNRKYKEGVYGYGTIVTDVTKASLIDRANKIYDRNNLQVGVHLSEFSLGNPLIPEWVVHQLPSVNQCKQPLIVANSLNYFGGNMAGEVKTILWNYYYLFNWFRGYTTDANYRFILHLLREKFLIRNHYKQYLRKVSNSPMVCEYCHIDFEKLYGKEQAKRLLELHDISDINSPSYIKIKIDDFKIICPTCHKLEHNKIRHWHPSSSR